MIVLDTCAVIWAALDPGKLTDNAHKAMRSNRDGLLICDISLWEISMLIKKQRLVVAMDTSGFLNLLLQAQSYKVQAITAEIAALSVDFAAEVSSDPADRLIAATSVIFNAPVVTADRVLRRAPGISTIW